MTQEQKDIIDCAADDVRRVANTLESVELILRDLGDLKADYSDPYSTRTEYIADKIYNAREYLDLAAELFRDFLYAEVTQKTAEPLSPEEELADTIARQKEESAQ